MASKLPIRRLPKESVKVLHVCSQVENIRKLNESILLIQSNIDKLNIIIVGNGHPEDGLSFKVAKVLDRHTEIKEGIDKIQISLKELSDKQSLHSQENFNLAMKAKDDLESYKNEQAEYNKGFAKSEERVYNRGLSTIQVLGVILAFLLVAGTTITSIISLTKAGKIESTVQQIHNSDNAMMTRGLSIGFDSLKRENEAHKK